MSEQHNEPAEQARRVGELRDIAINSGSQNAFFRRDDDKLTDPVKRAYFVHLERELLALDEAAWAFLKEKVRPLLATPDSLGWTQLFDTLNEAKGYAYLVKCQHENVHFIPESKIKGHKTPDIEATLESIRTLCEVKTINISREEAERRKTGGVGTVEPELDPGLLNKINGQLSTATAQLMEFDNSPKTRRIIFVVINFDERIECQSEYRAQVQSFIDRTRIEGCKVVISD